jgi:D-alanyl-D-alanine carboxypeptidase
MRRTAELAALSVAVVVGYLLAGVVGAPALVEPSDTPGPGPRTEATTTTTTLSATTTTAPERAETYLVWSTGGLTADLVAGLESTFEDLSVVRGDVVEMDTGVQDWVVPLDALAIDPDDHAPFDPDATLQVLASGNVVLGESSAAFRDVDAGDTLTLDGSTYQIAGIVPDEVIGAAEIVFAKSEDDAPVTVDRYALISTDLPRADFEAVVRSLYDGPAPLRIRSEGETPWLRHGDAVLPQIFIKEALGEFSYHNRSGSEFSQDEVFLDARIISAEVPILGQITCHEAVVEMVRGALGQLMDEGLSHLVDPSEFAGCWNPRFIRTITGKPAGISRHAWGAAVDINAASNSQGSVGDQSPRLVEIMEAWGFTWGGDWVVPDGMHFEYGIPPGS